MHQALSRDPDFFVHLLKLIYLPAEDSGVVESKPQDMVVAQRMASQAWEVLHEWAHVPGADERGLINPVALEDWVKRARKMLAEVGRTQIGDSMIGEILSAAIREPDQPWPPEPARHHRDGT